MAERRTHEPDLTDVRPIARTLLLTPVLVLASGWLLWQAYQHWRPQPSPPLFAPQPAAPERVRLQENPRADLREYRAHVQRRLHGYGWVDRDTGVVHIPIGRAMDLLVERGLPGEAEKERKKEEREKPAAENSGREVAQ